MNTPRSITTAALALLLATGAAAGLDAQGGPVPQPKSDAVAPRPQPAQEVRFPAFQQKTLANGLTVVVIEQHEQPAVSLRLLGRAGALFEPVDKPGLAQATAALLTEGTATRSSQQIAGAIDQIGGQLGAGAGYDAVYASAQVTADQIDLGLELLADIVLHPSFPPEEVERWRRQTLAGLKVQLESPSYLADVAQQRILYGAHPYGLPLQGTPETVAALTRDDLMAFHRSRYVPNEAILAVVGDVQPAAALAKVERAFGGWQRGAEAKVPPLPPAPEGGRKLVVIDKPDAVQTEIRVAQRGIAYTDPDYFVAEVSNSVLGGSPASRLFDEVRRKKGLAYGAYSTFREDLLPGPFTAATSTKTESTVDALATALDVVRGLSGQPVPAAELSARKTYISGAFPLEIETPDGIATKVLEAMFYGYGKDFLESYRGKIDAVAAEQVQDFARRHLDADRMTLVLVGNAKAFLPELEKRLGKAEVIPYRELDPLAADLRKTAEKAPAAGGQPAPSPGNGSPAQPPAGR